MQFRFEQKLENIGKWQMDFFTETDVTGDNGSGTTPGNSRAAFKWLSLKLERVLQLMTTNWNCH